MSSSEKAFWLFCIPSRVALALLAKEVVPNLGETGQVAVRLTALAPALIWLFGVLPPDTNFAGQDVWWDELRKVHGMLYLWYAFTLDHRSLIIDVALGVWAQLVYKHSDKSSR